MEQSVICESEEESVPLNRDFLEKQDGGRKAKCRGLGIPIGILSAGFSVSCAIFVKLLKGLVDPFSIYLIRSAAFLVLIGIPSILLLFQEFGAHSRTEYLCIFFMSIVDTAIMLCQYFAFQLLYISEVMALFTSSPVLISFFGCLLFKKKCDIFTLSTVLICTSGLTVLIYSEFQHHKTTSCLIGYILALCSALGWAINFSMSKCVNEISIYIIISCNAFISTFAMSIYLATTNSLHLLSNFLEIGYVSLTVGCSFGSIFSIILALKKDTPIMASIGKTLEIMFGLIIDIMLFNWNPSWMKLIGILIIFTGITIPAQIKACKENVDYTKNKKNFKNKLNSGFEDSID